MKANSVSPSISIIIPAYNAERFLLETLRSAAGQTWPNFEIILVDDGSTDTTKEIAQEFSKAVFPIKIISQPNAGVAAARNTGIAEARGQYVAFLDADDLWHSNKLKTQMDIICRESVERYVAAFSLHVNIDERGIVLRMPVYWPFDEFSLPTVMVLRPVGNGSSIIVKRDVALQLGGFDPSYAQAGVGGCEDLDFELRIAAKYPIACVRSPHVGYRTYSGNMSSNSKRMARSMHATIDTHCSINKLLAPDCIAAARYRAYEYSVAITKAKHPLFAISHLLRMTAMRPLETGAFVLKDLIRLAQRPFSTVIERQTQVRKMFYDLEIDSANMRRHRDLEPLYHKWDTTGRREGLGEPLHRPQSV